MLESTRHLISRNSVGERIGAARGVFAEFRKFAMRGSVVDLAVGIIVGGAFNRIVSSLVNDILMPPIGLMLGSINFSNLYVNLGSVDYGSLAEAKAAGAPTVNYGAFINEVIAFLITAFAVFLLVRFINRLHDEEEVGKPHPVETKECRYCKTQVRTDAVRCPACTSELR